MRFERGNALIYVLVGVALFGLLSYTLQRNVGRGQATISTEQTELLANQLISHANQVQVVIQQMLMTGTLIQDLDFVKPGEAGYDTAPHFDKVFHPSGGGAPVFNETNEDFFGSTTTPRGWQGIASQNIEWSASTANDSIYSFIYLDDTLCAKVNELINGSSTIPSEAGVGFSTHFIGGGGDDVDLDTADCATCEGVYQQCIDNTVGNVFYNVMASE